MDVTMKAAACSHEPVEASLDRWTEAHWHIHRMEEFFHFPDQFRYSANAFLRSIKEIPQIMQMELQKHPEYRGAFQPILEALRKDQLFAVLSEKRDFVVHRGMLRLHSKGSIGTTEGRGFKISFGFAVSPDESSDEAYGRFLELCRKDPEIRELMGPDCDSRPCLARTWRIQDLPDDDLLEICIRAWRTVGEALSKIVEQLGGPALDLTLDCRHSAERVRMKVSSARKSSFRRSTENLDLGHPVQA